jgi:hypothetical protein
MLHATLKDALDREFAAALLEPVELCRDALLVRLRNEVTIELRMSDASEYSIGWRWGDAELRIDTAPMHRQLSTFPNHLHDSDGTLRADPLTRPGDEPWNTVRSVIAALLEDPLLHATDKSPSKGTAGSSVNGDPEPPALIGINGSPAS